MKLLENQMYLDDIQKSIKLTETEFLNKKKVLVTGATGLICSTIIDYLIVLNKCFNAEITIYAAGRNANKVRERFGMEVKFVQYDALQPINIQPIDLIIHGAGNASPDLYINNPVETMLGNINGVNNLLEYCKNNKATRMVYISSSEVYGTKEKAESFLENDYGIIDQDNIRNSYAEAKRASEMLCKAYASEYGVHVCMIRPGHVFGPSATKDDRRISSDFAYKSARGNNLDMLSFGLQKRSYCYSIDCAAAIITVLGKGLSGEAYNIGTNESISIREMASILACAGEVKLLQKDPTVEEEQAFNPMNNSTLDGMKLFKLGYKQCFSAKNGLTNTVKILNSCLKNENKESV